jgi:hypothetical protein
MDKKQSLEFLQNCINNVNNATDKEIEEFCEKYNEEMAKTKI